MNHEELTPEERAAFDELSNFKLPPASLEARVINELKNQGLIEKQKTMNIYLKWTASVAASVLIFFAGSYWGKQSIENSDIDPNLAYMLILHEDESFRPGDPMAMFEEYGNWMQDIIDRGIKITGHELDNEAVMVKASSETHFGEEATERTSGYFIVEAESREEALEIARKNPHVKYGGTIELKPYVVR